MRGAHRREGPSLTRLRQIKIKLRQHRRISRSLRSVEDFDADDAAFIVVIDDDAVCDLCAVLDGAVGQIDVDSIGFPVDSHAHGLERFWIDVTRLVGDSLTRLSGSGLVVLIRGGSDEASLFCRFA
jgi:hypothetical protein